MYVYECPVRGARICKFFQVFSSLLLFIRVLTSHNFRVESVAWSPDGKQIASGSNDTTIKIWDSQSGDCQSTLTEHSGWWFFFHVFSLFLCWFVYWLFAITVWRRWHGARMASWLAAVGTRRWRSGPWAWLALLNASRRWPGTREGKFFFWLSFYVPVCFMCSLVSITGSNPLLFRLTANLSLAAATTATSKSGTFPLAIATRRWPGIRDRKPFLINMPHKNNTNFMFLCECPW